MDALDEIINSERVEPKTFHPVHERDPSAWFPGNEAASLVVQIDHVWDDLLVLVKLRNSSSDDYCKKLLLKYAVIEVRSLIELFDRLRSLVMKANIFDPKERQGWREVTAEEHEKVKELLKDYSSAKKKAEKDIIDIRNSIGAHRGNLDWHQVMRFWDAVTPELINPILKAIPPVFDYIKELDLYEWNRIPRDGSVEFIGAVIRSEYVEKWFGETDQ